jgi:coniferyl-aldehyde dehydrogenase
MRQHLEAMFAAQRQAFAGNPMPPAAQRRQWLKSLREACWQTRQLIAPSPTSAGAAPTKPCSPNCPRCRAFATPNATSTLDAPVAPARRPGLPAGQRQSVYQPLGVVGIIVPWNYPLFLAIGPLTCALAAGNRVMLKLSEATPATGLLLKALLERVFPTTWSAWCWARPKSARRSPACLRSPAVHRRHQHRPPGDAGGRAQPDPGDPGTGRQIPAIVSADVPLEDAAERIAFGKTLNAGQTCVAPDYVLVPRERLGLRRSLPARCAVLPTIADNPDYTAIINERQLPRCSTCWSAPQQGALLTCTCEGPGPPHAATPAAQGQRQHDR